MVEDVFNKGLLFLLPEISGSYIPSMRMQRPDRFGILLLLKAKDCLNTPKNRYKHSVINNSVRYLIGVSVQPIQTFIVWA
jgi:hypothetical protein